MKEEDNKWPEKSAWPMPKSLLVALGLTAVGVSAEEVIRRKIIKSKQSVKPSDKKIPKDGKKD